MPFLTVLDNINSKIDGVQKFIKEEIPPEPEPILREITIPTLDVKSRKNKTDTKDKNNIKKGTAFESYVGSQYEGKRYVVEYYGKEKHSHDLGRDLICKFHNYTVIVQCKYYKDTTVIRLNDVYIFYASVKHYASEHPQEIVSASLWTNQNMVERSPRAYSAALALGIQIYQGVIFNQDELL